MIIYDSNEKIVCKSSNVLDILSHNVYHNRNLKDRNLIQSLGAGKDNELQLFIDWFDALNKVNEVNKCFGTDPLELTTGIYLWYKHYTKYRTPEQAYDKEIKWRHLDKNGAFMRQRKEPMLEHRFCPVTQYEALCGKIIREGQMVENKRTGKKCLTIINADMVYDVGANEFPLVTTRKSYYKAAIAELLGYLRGYNSAKQFREIGCNTWNANANENPAWLDNPYREGDDDMGRVYGVQGRYWINQELEFFDQLEKVYNNLRNGIDDRGEIVTFYNPGEIEMGCLRPCMHTHTFSIIGDTLHLTSYQRSCDVPLGLNFNQVQVFVLLKIMAQITGLKPGKAYHKIINAHIYEDQLELMKVQLKREPLSLPTLDINPKIKTLEDIETWVSTDDFTVNGYNHWPELQYPFSV